MKGDISNAGHLVAGVKGLIEAKDTPASMRDLLSQSLELALRLERGEISLTEYVELQKDITRLHKVDEAMASLDEEIRRSHVLQALRDLITFAIGIR